MATKTRATPAKLTGNPEMVRFSPTRTQLSTMFPQILAAVPFKTPGAITRKTMDLTVKITIVTTFYPYGPTQVSKCPAAF